MPSASTICLSKGLSDLALAASLMFAPEFVFTGPVNDLLSNYTGLPLLNPYVSPAETFTLGALVLGASVGAIRAGRSQSPEAHQTVAAVNGTFAFALILAHLLSPSRNASAFSLLLLLQDLGWTSALLYYGNFNVLQTFGITSSPHSPTTTAPSPSGSGSGSGGAGSFNPANTSGTGGVHVPSSIGDLKEEAGRAAGELKREAEVHGITLGNVLTGERTMEEKNARGGAVRRDVAGSAERVYQ